MDTPQPQQSQNSPSQDSWEPESQPKAPAQQPKQPRFTILKTLVITYVIINVLYFIAAFIIMILSGGTTSYSDSYDHIPTLLGVAITFFISPLLAIIIVRWWERKKYPQQPAQPQSSNAPAVSEKEAIIKDAKNAGSFILLMLLFGVLIFFVCAGGTLAWATSACEGNDCGAGWFWGFILLPGSFIVALIFAPICAALVQQSRNKKKGL